MAVAPAPWAVLRCLAHSMIVSSSPVVDDVVTFALDGALSGAEVAESSCSLKRDLDGKIILCNTSSGTVVQLDDAPVDSGSTVPVALGQNIAIGRMLYRLDSARAARPKAVRASHILIKHKGSRRAASWRDPDGKRILATDLSLALEQMGAVRKRIIRGGISFAEAAAESDCSSASVHGDLGSFQPGQMQRAFENVAFSLAVNELSQVLQTDSGVHIILRTE